MRGKKSKEKEARARGCRTLTVHQASSSRARSSCLRVQVCSCGSACSCWACHRLCARGRDSWTLSGWRGWVWLPKTRKSDERKCGFEEVSEPARACVCNNGLYCFSSQFRNFGNKEHFWISEPFLELVGEQRWTVMKPRPPQPDPHLDRCWQFCVHGISHQSLNNVPHPWSASVAQSCSEQNQNKTEFSCFFHQTGP